MTITSQYPLRHGDAAESADVQSSEPHERDVLQTETPARVLIADDDAPTRELVRTHLELAGHAVVGEAVDGAHALRLIDVLRPDVLVLDMQMPQLTGREVLRALAGQTTGMIPAIIAYSASDAELAAALDLGADAAVAKDGDLTFLIDTVSAIESL